MLNNMLTIGQLAKRTGETIRTLRYYDKIGLLKPSDYSEGGHRLYSLDDLIRMQQIQALKFIGFSLKDISLSLESDQTDQQILNQSIIYKKKELIAQQEETQRTIDQLNHMETIISDQRNVDLRVFCFIIHSILWEENNLFDYNRIGNSTYNITSTERAELDKEYFSLFTDLKQLVANKVSPQSNQAMRFIKKLSELHKLTLSKSEDVKVDHEMEPEVQNILNPFTEDERMFIMSAFAFMAKLQE